MGKKLLYLPIIIFSLFVSCRKIDILPDPALTPAMARDTLYNIMHEWYYWNNLMPNVTKEDYDDPYTLLEAMRYKTLDRWSFISDYDEFIAQMQGTFVGHGFRIGVDNNENARIAMIYNNSPLYANGVRRGWIVKKINNIEVAPILISGDYSAYSNLIGASQAGITNTFDFVRPDGSEVSYSSTKSSFIVNTVLHYDTLHLSSGITGQLVFDSFITPSYNELASAFAFFKENNIKDLILDLRYNSGGYLYIAQTLASYIAGDEFQGTIFARLMYNNTHQDANNTYPFLVTSSSLSLSRLVVITSRSTASASEAVINGLKPHIEVTSIGDTTDGKPTGMHGWNIGYKYFMWPVTFTMENASGEGDYFEGIIPAKVISDDITHDFADREELCLNEAIYYLENGSVSGKHQSEFKRYPQFSDKPSWMNNVFVLEK